MTFKQAMAELQALGTAQNIKIYTRHGANPEKMFGVSYAHLNKLAKQFKQDHVLAKQLWDSGNLDAMVLATLIADPETMSKGDLDAWARDTNSCFMAADYFTSKLVMRSPYAKSRAEKWCRAKGEGVRRCGWSVLAQLAHGGADLTADELTGWLKVLEAEIHGSPNRTRQAMLGALVAIGGRADMHEAGLAAAKRVGPVEIDHGDTNCRTQDAMVEIEKIHQRRKAKWAKVTGS